jgi:hypothetical protein
MKVRGSILKNTVFLKSDGIRCVSIHVGIHLRPLNLILIGYSYYAQPKAHVRADAKDNLSSYRLLFRP